MAENASFSSAQSGYLSPEDKIEHLDYVLIQDGGGADEILKDYRLTHRFPEAKMVIGGVAKDLLDYGVFVATFAFKA